MEAMQTTCSTTDSDAEWFAMRDLKRPNALRRAYTDLADLGFEVFTPLHTVVAERGGRRVREQRPVINDLLFVHSTRAKLDPVVQSTDTLQYRFVKGAPAGTAQTVRADEMNRFIAAVQSTTNPRYYAPDEITTAMIGKTIKMICPGLLNGQTGTLLKIKGSNKKRLLVQLPGILSAAIEIAATDFVEVKQN